MKKIIDCCCSVYKKTSRSDRSEALLHLIGAVVRGAAFYALSPSTLGWQAAFVPSAFISEGLAKNKLLLSSVFKLKEKIDVLSSNDIELDGLDTSHENIETFRKFLYFTNGIVNAVLTTAYLIQGAEIGNYNVHQNEAESAQHVAIIGASMTFILHLLYKTAERYLSDAIDKCDSEITGRLNQLQI